MAAPTPTPQSQRPPAEGRLGRRPALDGLRAVAITLVILHHTGAFLIPADAGSLFPCGFLGVDLFMVLSGFLITTLLLERHEHERRPIATFYLRRVLRLLPAVVVLLLANLAYAVLEGGVGDALRSFVVVMLYVTNWAELAGVAISGYVTHLWSLAIEEQFYLVWPVALFALLRRFGAPRRIAWVALAIALAAALWRLALYESGDPWLRIYLRTDARADSLAIGAALALAGRDRLLTQTLPPAARSVLGVFALGALIAAAALLAPDSPFLYDGGFTVVAVCAAVVLACVLDGEGPLARALSVTPVVALGRLSYSLYLWHFGVFQIVAAHTAGWATAPRVLIGWGLALALAAASYLLVERPALALKGRLTRAT